MCQRYHLELLTPSYTFRRRPLPSTSFAPAAKPTLLSSFSLYQHYCLNFLLYIDPHPLQNKPLRIKEHTQRDEWSLATYA